MTFIALGAVVSAPPNTFLGLDDSANDELELLLEAPTAGSFVGYTGGQLSPFTVIFAANSVASWNLSSGSLTPAAVPEPPSLLLVLSALAGLGGVLLSTRISVRAWSR